MADRKVYGSFWEEFYDGYIIAHTKCSRPGFQTFGWKSEKENTFRITEVWQYASQHEWHLRDSLVLAYDSLNMRLKSFGTEFGHYPVDYSFIIFRNEVFKYLEKQEDYHIYFFETNVWAEEPGPLSTTLINGFVVINSNGKQMRVFHYWGEV